MRLLAWTGKPWAIKEYSGEERGWLAHAFTSVLLSSVHALTVCVEERLPYFSYVHDHMFEYDKHNIHRSCEALVCLLSPYTSITVSLLYP